MSRAVSDGHISQMNRVNLRDLTDLRDLRDRSLIAMDNYYTVQRFDMTRSGVWFCACKKCFFN